MQVSTKAERILLGYLNRHFQHKLMFPQRKGKLPPFVVHSDHIAIVHLIVAQPQLVVFFLQVVRPRVALGGDYVEAMRELVGVG